MRKILYLLLLLPIFAIAQSPDQNWIKTKTYKEPTTNALVTPTPVQAVTQVSYFDGLGRPIQQVAHAQSNSGKDIVTHIAYDAYGRVEKEFLPYANQTPSLNYNASAATNVLGFYSTIGYENTTNPYSQKQFEASPLNRVLKQAAPGNAWAMGSGKEIKFDYKLNEQSDLVYKFVADRQFDTANMVYNYTLVCQGYHPNSTVYKSIVKDENWTTSSGNNNTIVEYKDNFGRVVLKRAFNNNIKHDTYYVYDAIGNLIYVLPPTLSDEIVSISSNQVPYVFNKMIDYNEFLLSCNGSNVVGGGGLYVNIQNSFFVCHFNSSFTPAKIDLTKTFFLELPNLVPNQDLINFYGYTLYIESNTLKFKLNTAQQNCFNDLPNNLAFAFSLNSSQFANTINYTATVNQTLLQHAAYQYKYDYLNRLVEKKLPGKQWEYIVYDKLDRVVATGPAYNQYGGSDTSKGWLLTKYDLFNRPVYTAWYNAAVASSVNRKTLQDTYNNATVFSEIKTTSATTINGIATKYTNQVSPSVFVVLTVNYYDSYDYPNAPTIPAQIEEQNTQSTNLKGMPTGSWVRVLDAVGSTSNELSYTVYDTRYRPIRSYTKNYLGGFTQVDTKLDWPGKTLYTVTSHKRTASGQLFTVKERFTYTQQDRLLKHTHEIVGALPEQLLTFNTYDELGQLLAKNVGGTDVTGTQAIQKVNYKYNIRGWLTAINDVNNLMPSATDRDLFAFKINYNKKEDDTAGLFNGNISETLWRTSADNTKRKYAYNYDNLNRLLEANYSKPEDQNTLDNYLEKLSYDKAGNILTLERNGNLDPSGGAPVNQIDNLEYSYHPENKNQLLKVNDLSNSPQGFKDNYASNENDFTYDNNGNMTADINKEIESITYNHLNLPIKINFGAKGNIYYLYNAIGGKVKKVVEDNVAHITTTTDYLSSFQYKNAELQFFPHAEGYVHYTKPLQVDGLGAFNYVFNYTDHLGNVRLSYARDPLVRNRVKILEENHYYAFGLKHKNYNVEHLDFDQFPDTGVELVPMPAVANASYNYKYNGKELQEELGLGVYDYGARRYDPALGRWLSVDPLAEKYETLSPYNYVSNNPVNAIDPDGRLIVYVNGLLFSQALGMKLNPFQSYRPESWGTQIQTKGLSFNGKAINYWDVKNENGYTTRGEINDMFNDYNNVYVNGSHHFRSKASERFEMGRKAGNELIAQLQNGTIELTNEETIKIVGHSQGAAHAAGMLTQLLDSQYADRLEAGIYLSPHQPGGFSHPVGVFGAQFSTKTDRVSSRAGVLGHLMELFNGSSELKEIKGSDFLMIRPEHKGNKGGHDAESWNNILKQINDFLNN
ncbi:MAG: RHS repeat-associated core domain-containing protein [Bacteroidia bacterium]|nr:RHS repeat-associated core domain-containing protein [Bacteroidia bacterium]